MRKLYYRCRNAVFTLQVSFLCDLKAYFKRQEECIFLDTLAETSENSREKISFPEFTSCCCLSEK